MPISVARPHPNTDEVIAVTIEKLRVYKALKRLDEKIAEVEERWERERPVPSEEECYEMALFYDSILSYLWPYFFLSVALSLSLHLIFGLIGSYLIQRLYSILEGHLPSYRYLVLCSVATGSALN